MLPLSVIRRVDFFNSLTVPSFCPRYYEVIRLLSGHQVRVVASLHLTALRGPGQTSRGKGKQRPAAAVPNTVPPRLDIGRRVPVHSHSDRPAFRGFTCVRCCGASPASIPHALAGADRNAQIRLQVSCSCLQLVLASSRPHRGLPPPITYPCPARPVALRAPSVTAAPSSSFHLKSAQEWS